MSYFHPSALTCQREIAPTIHLAKPIRSLGLAQLAPLKNLLLAALPYEDYCRLLPYLEPVLLPKGWVMHREGCNQTHLYFITERVVSRYYTTEDGKISEFSTAGNEGAIGMSLYLGNGVETWQTTVLVEGFAFRLRADLLKRELAQYVPLLKLLLRYTQSVIAEIEMICACNRHHALQHRQSRCC